MKMRKLFMMTLLCTFLLLSCTSETTNPQIPAEDRNEASAEPAVEVVNLVRPYEDIRFFIFDNQPKVFEQEEYDAKDIITFTFNEGTVLKGSEELQKEIMENEKNPGLDIRRLHEAGITGAGVNVGIIDQNLLLNHPEFAGKIAAYYDTGCEQDEDSGSMHAPAVTSLLVGDTIGVAPGAKVFFAAAPSWTGDSQYYAAGLDWIIEENRKLPENEKIRVVSVSAAPSGSGSLFTQNQTMWDEAVLAAQQEGILVLDCRNDTSTGIIGPAFYDPEDPGKVERCKTGWPDLVRPLPANIIGVPCSYRTVAEEYRNGFPSYQYTGEGGLSWAIPYASGVLALGWQVNPELSNEEMIHLLYETCHILEDGSKVIHPTAFIDRIKALSEGS